ncbi:MAG: hypothetical protein NTY38_00375, partial [Acidobacteria bacterium]|nr:hypothetical protein [Acidobacteriota bacterium]
ATFELRIELRPAAGATESRTITIRPAPAVSPVTYYADFGDDLINIFGAGLGSGVPSLHHELREGGASAGIPPSRGEDTFIRYDKAGFDQYFRRLQCQGVAHEILWLYPFPFITDPTVYGARDWDLYQKQASAILRDPRFTRIMLASKALTDWGLLRDQFPIRADPRIHQAISRSAIEHGIQLGVSYRPFEHAASKYYQLPAFSADGEFLWMFQPLSSPAVNVRASEVGFAHYREILHADATRIELRPATDPETFLRRFRLKRDNLRIVASDYPPIQSDSFVLVRKADGAFRLAPFGEIERAAGARRFEVRNFDVDYQPANGVIVITGLKIPRSFTYLVLDNPSAEAGLTLIYSRPARLLAADGAELGRNAAYFAFPETSPEFKNTRIAGIKPDAAGHAIFFATEASGALLHRTRQNPCLDTSVLVINRGEPYSREMVDYNQPAARRTAIRELRAILRYPAFREIYVNTRSHTALTAELGDGEDGIQPLARYRAEKRPAGQLGIDLAYAPRGAALAGFSAAEIAQPKPGEWKGPCQTPDCTSRWRYARNQAIAQGVRKLLDDIQQSFPGTRLRIVLPERAPVQAALAAVQKQQPEGTVPYTANRNNYISNIGEGLALLDLAGTRFETVLLGVGPFVAPSVLTAFLDAAIPDAEGHRHSSYRGPSGIMYEGQWTLKDEAGRQARERNMCLLLSRPGRISEVIVYEAADWTYRLPWGGFEFLGNCSTSGVTGSRNAQQNAPAK